MKEYRIGTASLINALQTVDSFQGKQADVVVVSLVRNNLPTKGPRAEQVRHGIGFLESPERSTVIFSRAQNLLVFVGCLEQFKRFPGTSMFDVAQEIESLARTKSSSVAILPGKDFLENRHWEALERYHEWYEQRQRQRQEMLEQQLARGYET
jgi:hypothetical protein